MIGNKIGVDIKKNNVAPFLKREKHFNPMKSIIIGLVEVQYWTIVLLCIKYIKVFPCFSDNVFIKHLKKSLKTYFGNQDHKEYFCPVVGAANGY